MSTAQSLGLRLENIHFAYEEKAPIFVDITTTLPTAPAVWVTAEKDRGRSTLLRLLAGLDTAQSGRYLLNGVDVNQMSFEDFLPYRLKIGYGFEFGGLLNNKSLVDNLLLPLEYHNLVGHDEARARVDEMISRFDLSSIAHQRPFAISGSQRKLGCVLRAFVHHPEVVFLDEPVVGLKADHSAQLIQFIKEGYAERGLAQVFYTGESSFLAKHVDTQELVISKQQFSQRAVA